MERERTAPPFHAPPSKNDRPSLLSEKLLELAKGIEQSHRTGFTVSPHKLRELADEAAGMEADLLDYIVNWDENNP
jgi:hypothetical protein